MGIQPFPQEHPLKKSQLLHKLVFALIATIFLVGALYIVQFFIFSTSKNFQAVFLSNGQVYFGNIEKRVGGKYVRLVNVYYLQAADKELQAADTTSTTDAAADLSLIKLGNELHGPQDAMLINRDHIIFIEDLKKDSKVVKSIEAFQGE